MADTVVILRIVVKFYVEYSIVPYVGKERKHGEEGYSLAYMLKPLSVGLLEDDLARFNFEMPCKKQWYIA